MLKASQKAHISKSLKETEVLAVALLNELLIEARGAKVLLFKGNLGAGKTTFTQGLAKALGIKAKIISPTFILEKKYPIKNHKDFDQLIHIDAYRFETEDETKVLRLEEDLSNKRNLIIIEWPEQMGKNRPKGAQKISFESLDENTKKITW